MRYSEDLIEEIRTSNDIIETVSDYVKLKNVGKYLFGLCPFHNEKTASFSVTPSKQIFYCYSCGVGGNVIQFIMNVERLSFVDAIKLLADKKGISVPEDEYDKSYQETYEKKKKLIKLSTDAAKYFYENLNSTNGEIARDYIRNRELSKTVIRKFGIGYSHNSWDALYKYLKSKDYSDDLILESGLISKDKSNGYYDRFRNRIIFPIFDIRGNVIAFGGRVIDSGQPKYMNSPETIIYSKNKTVYSMNFAKNEIIKQLILVEGYIDVIALYDKGIKNVVAPLGTALTENQAKIIKLYKDEVIIAFDSDIAGKKATKRALDILNDVGIKVKVLNLKDFKDPDEYIQKNGVDRFQGLINSAISMLDYKVLCIKESLDLEGTDGQIEFLNKIALLLSSLDNEIERELYAKKFIKDYKISENSLFNQINKNIKKNNNVVGTGVVIKIPKKNEDENIYLNNDDNKLSYYEKLMLVVLVEFNELKSKLQNELTIDFFTNLDNKELAEKVFIRFNEKGSLNQAEFCNYLNENQLKTFIKIFDKEFASFENSDKAFYDILNKVNKIKLDKRQNEILSLLSKKEDSSNLDLTALRNELNEILIKRSKI